MKPSALVCALYARASSDQQAKEHTIDSQLHALRQRIASDGVNLPDHLSFVDEGVSGGTLLRPALERLRDQIAAGAVERLYVHAPDRLARKYAYQVLLLDEFKRAGVEVVFLNHAPGDSPEEDLLLQVQGMIAEYERAKILERSRCGKLQAASRWRTTRRIRERWNRRNKEAWSACLTWAGCTIATGASAESAARFLFAAMHRFQRRFPA